MFDQIKIGNQGLHVATATCISLINFFCFISDLALKNVFETVATLQRNLKEDVLQ